MAAAALGSGLLAAAGAPAQESMDSILEKARAQAQETEKLKKILNEEPDQNVRLPAFNLMAKNGDALVLDLARKDRKAGTFSGSGGFKGEVTGTHLAYVWGRGSGMLELKDDDAVAGEVTVYYRGNLEFLAGGKIR
jgi:hypothetical protein